eukprot:CAMPEP_0203755702 /NCGR_PEP_ID=MMETSP0098-20131031/9107_1 /ASSEMBLY_ACC=CAM_ASM_000208 /TAXON_ID=96639 /ORGANISM=" , Strain NY0313808BC1" /LENGTH=930 /DNA_ID=CAMNT_0050647279 /DNA_START=795 /DNA_END=3587 /DNA_ORIENTATION=-
MFEWFKSWFAGCGAEDDIVDWNTLDENHVPALCFELNSLTPLYSAKYVGGKAYSVGKLQKTGVNVPSSVVVSTKVYREVVERLEKQTGQSLSSWIQNDASIDALRNLLKAKPGANVPESVKGELRRLLDPSKRYAVRSSATTEDGKDSSFAGQFLTELNIPGNIDDISTAIERCWASCFAESVKTYLTQTKELPDMAVLIMEQLDSDVAGVLFQANPVTNSRSTWVINVAYGQGSGVVNGTLPVDEYVLLEKTKAVVRKSVEHKDKKLVLSSENTGLELVDVSPELRDKACLTESMIDELVKAVTTMTSAYKSAQDIEFAVAANKLYILQFRPITSSLENLDWTAPDIGLWQVNGHLTSPPTRIYGECWKYGFSVGSMETSEISGAGFAAVDTAIINGFSYFCLRQPGPKAPPTSLPPPFIMRMIMRFTAQKSIRQATKFWEEKQYLSFVEEWEKEIKPALIKGHLEHQRKDLSTLSDKELVVYLAEMVEYGKRMYKHHSEYCMYNLAPLGFFVLKAEELSDGRISRSQAFNALSGASVVSEGLHGEFPETIGQLMNNRVAREIINSDAQGKAGLDKLEASLSGKLLDSYREMISHIEYRLADGYDIANETLKEQPGLLWAGIKSAVSSMEKQTDPAYAKQKQQLEQEKFSDLRQQVIDKSKLSEFDEALSDARATAPIRDERALYTDLWAMGILRHVILEAGRRIVRKSKRMNEPTLALEATLEELTDMLSPSWKEDLNFWATLRGRRSYRQTASIRDAPELIGGIKVLPTRAHFPNEYFARTALATILVVDEIFAAPDCETEDVENGSYGQGSCLDANTTKGSPGANGTYTGRVCVIKSANDLQKIQQGDVVVTTYSSSLVNFIIPICGALVTDFGAQLSHAAICAREANIPCVVGTKYSTVKFKDGDVVTVDGTRGIVTKTTDSRTN